MTAAILRSRSLALFFLPLTGDRGPGPTAKSVLPRGTPGDSDNLGTPGDSYNQNYTMGLRGFTVVMDHKFVAPLASQWLQRVTLPGQW